MIRGARGRIFLLPVLLFVAATAIAQQEGDALEQTFERGPVQATIRLSPAAPVIGDVLTLDLEVVAEPAVELLMPEFGEALGRFEIVDFAPSERIDDEGRTIARQTYRLQPARSGPQSIPPLRELAFVVARPVPAPVVPLSWATSIRQLRNCDARRSAVQGRSRPSPKEWCFVSSLRVEERIAD